VPQTPSGSRKEIANRTMAAWGSSLRSERTTRCPPASSSSFSRRITSGSVSSAASPASSALPTSATTRRSRAATARRIAARTDGCSSTMRTRRPWAWVAGSLSAASAGSCVSTIDGRSYSDSDSACGSALADDDHVAREERDPVGPAGIDVEHDQLLDADAHLALEVDPGLHREHRAPREGLLRAPGTCAVELVRRQADPVTQAVAVHRPPPVRLDHGARERVV